MSAERAATPAIFLGGPVLPHQHPALHAHAASFAPLPLQDFQPIDRLETMGIAAADIKKLKEKGYHTVESVRGEGRSP